MVIATIKAHPTVIDNNHESLYRSYQTLEHVKEMLCRGDSNQTILEVIEECEQPLYQEKQLFKKLYLTFIETCDSELAGDPKIKELIKKCDKHLNL